MLIKVADYQNNNSNVVSNNEKNKKMKSAAKGSSCGSRPIIHNWEQSMPQCYNGINKYSFQIFKNCKTQTMIPKIFLMPAGLPIVDKENNYNSD